MLRIRFDAIRNTKTGKKAFPKAKSLFLESGENQVDGLPFFGRNFYWIMVIM